MTKTMLIPVGSQKSFYGKAIVISQGDGTVKLQSYNTIVCSYDVNGNFQRHWNGYSATTAKHVDSFRRMAGDGGLNKKAWEAL